MKQARHRRTDTVSHSCEVPGTGEFRGTESRKVVSMGWGKGWDSANGD